MARPSKQKERQPPKDPFVNVTSSQAKREKGTLSARSVASQLYIKELKATKEQEQTIHTLYSEGCGFDTLYGCLNEEDQVNAAALIASLGLDIDTRESVANRWHVRWATGKSESTQRVLYQW